MTSQLEGGQARALGQGRPPGAAPVYLTYVWAYALTRKLLRCSAEPRDDRSLQGHWYLQVTFISLLHPLVARILASSPGLGTRLPECGPARRCVLFRVQSWLLTVSHLPLFTRCKFACWCYDSIGNWLKFCANFFHGDDSKSSFFMTYGGLPCLM